MSSQLRREHDSMGGVDVPAEALWGAQTQRSCNNFAIGDQRMPSGLIHSLAESGMLPQKSMVTTVYSTPIRFRRLNVQPRPSSTDATTSSSPKRLADRQRHPDKHERQ